MLNALQLCADSTSTDIHADRPASLYTEIVSQRAYLDHSMLFIVPCHQLYNSLRDVVQVHDGRIGVQANGMELVAILAKKTMQVKTKAGCDAMTSTVHASMLGTLESITRLHSQLCKCLKVSCFNCSLHHCHSLWNNRFRSMLQEIFAPLA